LCYARRAIRSNKIPPRARLNTPDGKTTEWKSKALRAYQRRTLVADALIASTYLAGTNTRRVRRALGALFGGAVGKDTVSRVWRKVKGDWDAWNARSLADEPIVRLILDGTVVRVRLDRKATAISLLVVIGVRADGQKMLIAIKSMGGESTEAWRAVLDDLIQRGLRRPEIIIDGAHRGSKTRSPPCGTACRSSAVQCTSTGTCWRTRLSGCARRSPPITTT
jgi:transposase-like protein